MSQNNGFHNRSEKGLLTPDNCVVALIDHQPQMLFGTSNFDRQSIINNTVALGKAARVFDVPVVLTTVETKSFSGNMWPQLRAVFPGQDPIERSSMNSSDRENRTKENCSGRLMDGDVRCAPYRSGDSRWLRNLRGRGLLRRCEPAGPR